MSRSQATADDAAVQQACLALLHVTIAHAGPSLSTLPPLLSLLHNLQTLTLSGGALTELPASLSLLVQLQALTFSRNQLSSLPAELGSLARLTSLDLSGNTLTTLPTTICELTALVKLNLMDNRLQQLPADIGALTGIRILGLKGNALTHLPDSFTRLASLQQLFLTGNRLEELPAGFSALSSLVKMQASFNALPRLPGALLHLPALEMLRLAVCNIAAMPSAAVLMAPGVWPRMAWFSLAGNPVCEAAAARLCMLPDIAAITLAAVAVEEGGRLGAGASGEVCRATWRGQTIALKRFHGALSPDGATQDEVRISASLDHPRITRVLAVAADEGAMLLRLVPGQPLADRPTQEVLLRCRWPADRLFSAHAALVIAHDLASALRYMHAAGVCHGDVYAHNVLLDAAGGHATLCDMGASFLYDRRTQPFWEAMEVRAFGLLLQGLLDRRDTAPRSGTQPDPDQEQLEPPIHTISGPVKDTAPGGNRRDSGELSESIWRMLQAIAGQCCSEVPSLRPQFCSIEQDCGGLLAE
ncbi:MAG: hypothetical protein WDW36_010295 [Sanguina aurantia]